MISIRSIKISKWMRSNEVRIDLLASSLQRKGMIEPILVMEQSHGYLLLDGYRRVSAALSIGWNEIDANIIDRFACELWLYGEIANKSADQRIPLRNIALYMDLLRSSHQGISYKARIEGDRFIQPEARKKTLDIFGMNTSELSQSVYVARNGTPELINAVDQGKLDLHDAFRETKQQKRSPVAEPENCKPEPDFVDGVIHSHKSKRQRCEKKLLVAANERITELEEKVQQEYYRANIAEGNVRDLKEAHHNQIYHRDGIIESLRVQVRELQLQLKVTVSTESDCEENDSFASN
jgi:hypothetical protein